MGSRQAVIPGMRICAAEDHYQPGLGTYILHGYIYASLVGRLRLVSSKGRFLHLESYALLENYQALPWWIFQTGKFLLEKATLI